MRSRRALGRAARALGALGALGLLALALYLLGQGVWLALLGPREAERTYAALLASPIVADATALAALAPGQRVLVEGRVAPDEPARPFALVRGEAVALVAYERGRRDTTTTTRGTSTRVVVEERQRPAFAVALANGQVRLANTDYRLTAGAGGDYAPDRWVSGFAPGAPVLVDATVVATPGGGRALHATVVHRGPAGAYVNGFRALPAGVAWGRVFGLGSALLGLLALAGAGTLAGIVWLTRPPRSRASAGDSTAAHLIAEIEAASPREAGRRR